MQGSVQVQVSQMTNFFIALILWQNQEEILYSQLAIFFLGMIELVHLPTIKAHGLCIISRSCLFDEFDLIYVCLLKLKKSSTMNLFCSNKTHENS